ncbi:MAG TPA: bestrophin family ion channel [Flavobacteriaceae bacterium]|nr:bestrophin family ion channel [Flavobacteriaceae bacterium]
MYTKRNYSLRDLLRWTRHDIYKFVLVSIIPILLYVFLNWKWLHLPWLPIALVGTAVAFIIGFKNSASYDRLWEARKIWVA